MLQVIFEIIFIFSLWIPLHLYVHSTTYNMYVCSCTCMYASDNNIYLYLLSIYWQSKKHVLNRVCFVLSAVALLLKKKSRTKQTKSTPGKITITWETTTLALWIWFQTALKIKMDIIKVFFYLHNVEKNSCFLLHTSMNGK